MNCSKSRCLQEYSMDKTQSDKKKVKERHHEFKIGDTDTSDISP
jgi:hypothetical protein